jgi:hypothetical protein
MILTLIGYTNEVETGFLALLLQELKEEQNYDAF